MDLPPPYTRLLRILAQSMTDNQGQKNADGMPNGLDNTVGLSLRFNCLLVLLIILTARKIMRKRINVNQYPSGAHEQNWQGSGALHRMRCDNVPRIFLIPFVIYRA